MAMYKCKNFGSCSRADSGEGFSLAAGIDDKCPECGSTLDRADKESDDSGSGNGGSGRRSVVIAAVAGVVVLVIAGAGYLKWRAGQVVVLKPDTSTTTAAPAPAPANVPPLMTPPAAEAQAAAKPAPRVVNERAARKICDEATKAKQTDAEKVCRHAAAVTLMNSGVLSAVDGKLDLAERDYLAARDKDPDLPELYFNLAVLKARQNKGAEALDNLTLASAKGFTQFSAIKGEPALQKLKLDPALKSKIEAFEAK